jgi:multiple sugar transport system substrate-binding protein
MNRRNFLRVTAGLGGAAFLSACAAPAAAPVATSGAAAAATEAPAAAAPAGDITLSVLNENWGDIYNNLMTEIGKSFTAANPSITLDWNFDPDWTTKLTTLIAANTPPDASIMRPGPLATLGAKGALLEMNDFVKSAGKTRDDFITPIYDSGVLNGKLFAVPGGADFICQFYSRDVYKDAGLDPEKPAVTTADFLEHSKQIVKKDSSGDLQRIGYVPSAGHLVNWAYIHGGKFYDEGSGKITANDPANVAALEYMKEFVKLYDVNKLAAFNSQPGMFEAGNPFSTKRLASVFDGFWFYEAIDQHAPDLDYGVTWWPTLKDTDEDRSRYAISGWMYSLPKGAKHTEDAWKFVRYAFIDEAARMGVDTLNGPCLKSALQPWVDGMTKKVGEKNRMAPYLHVFTDTGRLATNFFPIIPVQSYYTNELNRVYDLVMRDQMTPQAGLDEVTKNVQAELDKVSKGG